VAELNNITAKQLSILITEYYKKKPSGGNCHIVLDDLNIGNEDIEFCLNECVKKDDVEGKVIMLALQKMRKTARLKAISMREKK